MLTTSKKLRGKILFLIIPLLGLTAAVSGQTLERVWSFPQVGTFWSAQFTNLPPLPFLPDFLPAETPLYLLSSEGIYLYDDRQVDYEMLNAFRQATESVTYPPARAKSSEMGQIQIRIPQGRLG